MSQAEAESEQAARAPIEMLLSSDGAGEVQDLGTTSCDSARSEPRLTQAK